MKAKKLVKTVVQLIQPELLASGFTFSARGPWSNLGRRLLEAQATPLKRASIRPPGIPAPWEKWARRGSGSGRSFSMADAVSQCASFLMRQSQLQGAASECGAPEIQKARQLRICCIFWLRLRERASPAPSRALTPNCRSLFA